ncbi:hypothetical protein, partial [Klebsiella pneumoniae]|uniref:hypothetical protein n=1 Tax=Klebsiella pneumoniae TaxID=573 RepID=UPI001C9AEFFD
MCRISGFSGDTSLDHQSSQAFISGWTEYISKDAGVETPDAIERNSHPSPPPLYPFLAPQSPPA